MGLILNITGPPGVGKSTLVSRVVLRLMSAGVIVGGCVTAEKRKGGSRVGFTIRDLTNGTTGELASLDSTLGPRVGRYRVNLEVLSSVGAKGLFDAAARSEVIVIDEVGPMELTSPEFRKGVAECIDSRKPILAVVHERMEDDLLNRLRTAASEPFELTTVNREDAADEVFASLLKAAGGPKDGQRVRGASPA